MTGKLLIFLQLKKSILCVKSTGTGGVGLIAPWPEAGWRQMLRRPERKCRGIDDV